jgi:hypothetical protein
MTAARATTRRSLISYFTIIAGALFALDALLSLAAPGGLSWPIDLAELVLAASFVVVALTVSLTTLGTVAFWVGAVGWFLLAVIGLVGSLGVLGVIAAIAAMLGSLVAGILVYQRSTYSRRANVVFLAAMILAALFCLGFFLPFPGVLETIIALLFGAALIVAGVFILQKR